MLEAGIRSSEDMHAMNVTRITAGEARTLRASVMELNARTFEVRYFKEYKFKF